MSKIKRLPPRSKVRPANTWDLSSLYPGDEAWEADFKKLESKIKGYEKYRGQLGKSAKSLANCLKMDAAVDRLAERLAAYAFLKSSEDQANPDYQAMISRFQHAASQAGQLASFVRPEILAIPNARMQEFLASRELKPYRLILKRLLRKKKYTLGKREEKLLAMQSEMASTAGKTFRQLHDADLKFGLIRTGKEEQVELSNATFSQFLRSPNRSVRRRAFHQYYQQFSRHENTLAATPAGSIQADVYYARARGYDSALHKALFPDNVPQSVYDNLISTVRQGLDSVYRYLDVRRRKMKLKQIDHYDTYVPILSDLATRRTWNQAVGLVMNSLQPLGDEYCQVLEQGLSGRWCDRYPNQGKQSGAFSYGTFDGNPYILMNYQPEVLEDIFTLTHEAGHSMHSHYSSQHQPYLYYDYTIFVAEVASTFNEQLLAAHMLSHAKNDQERAFLINRELDSIRATIVRQTMFAEFEKTTHEMAEAGEPLTVASFKQVYHKLLEDYFGPEFKLDEELSLECFRIPHFYRAFYVYKYATGLSAAIALSQRVLHGGNAELRDYLNFLKGGCSKDPLDLLRDAGVDMERPEPVETAMNQFSRLVDELDALL